MKRVLTLAAVIATLALTIGLTVPASADKGDPVPTTTDSPKGPAPTPSPTTTPPPGGTPCEADNDPYPPSPDPVPYADSAPQIITTGYMGGSQTVEGYVTLGGTRFTTDGDPTDPAILPNIGIAHMNMDRYRFCGAWHSPFWSRFFTPQLGAEQAVWVMLATTDDEWRNGGATAIAPRIRTMIGIIRTYTQAPIYLSVPGYMEQSYPACKTIRNFQSDATQVAINQVVSEGLALAGPTFPALSQSEKLNRCHPNEVGKAIWGQVLLNFFG